MPPFGRDGHASYDRPGPRQAVSAYLPAGHTDDACAACERAVQHRGQNVHRKYCGNRRHGSGRCGRLRTYSYAAELFRFAGWSGRRADTGDAPRRRPQGRGRKSCVERVPDIAGTGGAAYNGVSAAQGQPAHVVRRERGHLWLCGHLPYNLYGRHGFRALLNGSQQLPHSPGLFRAGNAHRRPGSAAEHSAGSGFHSACCAERHPSGCAWEAWIRGSYGRYSRSDCRLSSY